MKTLPTNLILVKNTLDSTSSWVVLLTVTPSGGPSYRYTSDNADTTFGGNVYVAYPFELEAKKYQAQGALARIVLRIANVNRVVQGYVEAYAGGVGATVRIEVVHLGYLSENYTETTEVFQVLETDTNEMWVSFTLGATYPLGIRFPSSRYLVSHCRFEFKTVECGYTGSIATCNRTFTACKQRVNSHRYGGFMGLASGYYQIV